MEIPSEVQKIIRILEDAGYNAYAVGGCIRDLLRGVKPKDWDITTNTEPKEIQKLFSESFYENQFGTVGVKAQNDADWTQTNADRDQRESALSPRKSATIVEVTTFRIEEGYTDQRRPDTVRFVKTLEEDLARRDFTINAMALTQQPTTNNQQPTTRIIDPYGGQGDLQNKLIRAVGDANKRFSEDALRMMRAVRFAAEFGFSIEHETFDAIKKNAASLQAISQERIRDELQKIIMAGHASEGIRLLENVGLLPYVMPELRDGIDVAQNLHHIYTVFEHNVRALEYSAKKKYDFVVRMASLLHDVGKPQTKRGEGYHATFYGHDVVGARITEKLLERLRFPREIIDKVTLLVRYHLFYYNVGEVTESSVRRLLKNVRPENIDDLVKVREADRIGSGVPKAVPYKLRHFQYMVERVSKDPISAKMLAIDGNDLMQILSIEPGPKIGLILNALLGEMLDDPLKNTREYLTERAKEFNVKSVEELRKYLDMKEKKIQEEEEATKKKYYV